MIYRCNDKTSIAMKNIKKISSITFASMTAILVIWFATLAIRGYCSWGINGFAGYSLLIYIFMCVCHGFLDNALSAKTDFDFKENLEEI